MNNYTFKFKTDNPSSEERKKGYEKIKNSYPDKLPIICERHPEENELEELATSKFILPEDISLFKFKKMIEKKFKNPIDIDIFYNNEILSNMSMKELFEKYKDPEDNFIYVYYKKSLNKTKKLKFKDNLLKDRIKTFKSLSEKFPDKIPIICEKDPDCDELEEIEKTKYVIDNNMKISQFLLLLNNKNFFSFPICIKINDEIIDENETIENLYKKFKDKEDNFLYCFYSKVISNSDSSSDSNSIEIDPKDYEFEFKKKNSLEDRKESYKTFIEINPEKIPVICEKYPKSKLKSIEKNNFLINNKRTLNEFKLEIEKKIE